MLAHSARDRSAFAHGASTRPAGSRAGVGGLRCATCLDWNRPGQGGLGWSGRREVRGSVAREAGEVGLVVSVE